MDPKYKIVTDAPPSLSFAQDFCSGYVTLFPLGDGSQLLMREDANLVNLPANEEATKVLLADSPLHAACFDNGQIYGNVLHLRDRGRWS